MEKLTTLMQTEKNQAHTHNFLSHVVIDEVMNDFPKPYDTGVYEYI